MRPGASPRWVLRTGKSGPASPGAYTAAGLRSPLSASFVCPAPWRLRQGLGGAGGDRRAQLARAQRPQRTGLGSARGWPSAGGRRARRPLLRPLPARRPRPSLTPSTVRAASRHPCISPSALGCAQLRQALGPAPSVPSPSARQVRLGSARPRPRPSLTWWSVLTAVLNLLEGWMLCFPLCPSTRVVCLSVCLSV